MPGGVEREEPGVVRGGLRSRVLQFELVGLQDLHPPRPLRDQPLVPTILPEAETAPEDSRPHSMGDGESRARPTENLLVVPLEPPVRHPPVRPVWSWVRGPRRVGVPSLGPAPGVRSNPDDADTHWAPGVSALRPSLESLRASAAHVGVLGQGVQSVGPQVSSQPGPSLVHATGLAWDAHRSGLTPPPMVRASEWGRVRPVAGPCARPPATGVRRHRQPRRRTGASTWTPLSLRPGPDLGPASHHGSVSPWALSPRARFSPRTPPGGSPPFV